MKMAKASQNDLEIALKQHAERAEAAEAELLAVREDNHSMMLEIDGLRKELARLREQKPVAWDCGGSITANSGYAEWFSRKDHGAAVPLYTSHVPAPAVPSGWNIRRDGDVLIVQHPDIGGCSVQKEPDWERMIPEAILYSLADALLQSRAVKDSLTTQADCRACVNRGRVNGLSQESFCDSCIWQGMSWRKDHHASVVTASDTIYLTTDVPAPAVPADWREAAQRLIDAAGDKTCSPSACSYPFECCNHDLIAAMDAMSAMLQSAPTGEQK